MSDQELKSKKKVTEGQLHKAMANGWTENADQAIQILQVEATRDQTEMIRLASHEQATAMAGLAVDLERAVSTAIRGLSDSLVEEAALARTALTVEIRGLSDSLVEAVQAHRRALIAQTEALRDQDDLDIQMGDAGDAEEGGNGGGVH